MVDYEKLMGNMKEYLRSEEEAFKKAGTKIGRVEFECPLCKGPAIGNRYYYGGRIHGLGSYCLKCKISHS